MKTAILLGAGSSLAAGFPSTKFLSDLILSGNCVERHSSGSYQPTRNSDPMTGVVQLTSSMVRRLYTEAKCYFSARGEKQVNYEDLFYLAKQALDEERGEMENPAIRAFVDKLRSDMTPSILAAKASNDASYEPYVPGDFKTLIEETCNYISDIVLQRLCREPRSTDHLKIFVEACNSSHVIGIATLCHDTHVERYLRTQGISLADGFSDEQDGVRYWIGNLSSSDSIPFLKLHGSTDWYRLRPESSEPCFADKIGIPLDDGDPWHTQTSEGVLQDPLDGRPLLLIGTFNKVTEYSRGIFQDLHHRFRTILQEADRLCVCGYSFGDKGINSEIIKWYYAECGRRFLIIHPNPNELISNARGAIQNKWDKWTEDGSIELISKRLECVDADEVLRAIGCSCEH